MFAVADRDRLRDAVLTLAAEDSRIVAGALVGSLADGGGDRWSDLDLTFAVSDQAPAAMVLDDFTARLARDFDVLQLFDLPVGPMIYRVFLLPDGLQCDVSFTPASEFAPAGPKFQLLFGEIAAKPFPVPRPAGDVFGWGVAYARYGRACIDRGRPWQAEHCISAVRDHALELACRRRGLATRFGRGFDELPLDVLASFDRTLVRSLERDELLRAVEQAVECLLAESDEVAETAAKAAPSIRAWLEAD